MDCTRHTIGADCEAALMHGAQIVFGRAKSIRALAGIGLLVVTLNAPRAQQNPTGTICALAFNDTNKNGTHDPGEAPLSNVNMSLSINNGVVIANHLSNSSDSGIGSGSASPGQYCFAHLTPGQYTLTFSAPLADATTSSTFVVGVNAGDQLSREFGATPKTQTSSANGLVIHLTRPVRIGLSLAGALFAMLLMVGLGLIWRGIYGLTRRR